MNPLPLRVAAASLLALLALTACQPIIFLCVSKDTCRPYNQEIIYDPDD